MHKNEKKESMQETLRRVAGVDTDVLAHVKGGLTVGGSIINPIRIVLM